MATVNGTTDWTQSPSAASFNGTTSWSLTNLTTTTVTGSTSWDLLEVPQVARAISGVVTPVVLAVRSGSSVVPITG